MTTLNLELPLYGLSMDQIKVYVQQALQGISIQDLSEWKVKNSSDNQIVKRNDFFKKEK